MKAFAIVMAGAGLVFAAPAEAQQRGVTSGARITYPNDNLFSWERGHRRSRGGFGHGRVWIVEREVPPFDYAQDDREPVIVERVIQAPPPPPAPAANSGTPNRDVPGLPERKPYVVGKSYAALPGGCMKLIEEGSAYYYCGGGEWYKQMGKGRGATYRAVKRAAL